MQKHYISLLRTPERQERFLRVNAHVNGLLHSPGIDGKNLDLDEIRQKGFLGDGCEFTMGAVGSGLAHVSLWGTIAKSGEPGHIFEDDAFLCKNFEEESQRIISSLPKDWDIILWGNNSDTSLQFEMIPGIGDCIAHFSEEQVRQGIDTFRDIDVKSQAFRLKETFGICGYAVSPKGARNLIERCLPFTTTLHPHSCLNNRLIKTGSVDVIMNKHYRHMKAFTSFPPLCLTDNIKSRSLNAS